MSPVCAAPLGEAAELVLSQLSAHAEFLVDPVPPESIEDLLLSLPAFRPFRKHPSLRAGVSVLLEGFDELIAGGRVVESADGRWLVVHPRGPAS